MHKEEGKTGSWKSPAQNTTDSPGQRRALNSQQDTEQDDYAALTRSTRNKEILKAETNILTKMNDLFALLKKNV